MTIETTNSLSYLVREFYERTFLENLKAKLVFADFTKKYPVGQGFGPVVYFTRFTPFSGSSHTSALNEGVVPTEIQLTDERVSASALQYGNYVKVSDWILATNLAGYNPFIENAVTEISYLAKEVIDLLVRNAFGNSTGAVYQYANGKGSIGAMNGGTDVATMSDVRKIVRTLKKAKVPFYDNMNYIGIIGPGQSYDIQSETATGGWLDVNKYLEKSFIEKGEVGKLFSVRFIESPNLSSGNAGTGTVSECYFFGRDAVGMVDVTEASRGNRVEMKHIHIFIKDLGSAGTADPLNQIATVGYKFNMAAKRLQDSRVVIYRVGESA